MSLSLPASVGAIAEARGDLREASRSRSGRKRRYVVSKGGIGHETGAPTRGEQRSLAAGVSDEQAAALAASGHSRTCKECGSAFMAPGTAPEAKRCGPCRKKNKERHRLRALQEQKTRGANHPFRRLRRREAD